MCVYVYVCVWLHLLCWRSSDTDMCVYVEVWACDCVWVCVWMHVCVDVGVYVNSICARLCEFVCGCMHAYYIHAC